MFFKKIKSEEYKILLERLKNLERKFNLIEIDLSFLTVKLEKAVRKRLVKAEEEKDNSKKPVLLPE